MARTTGPQKELSGEWELASRLATGPHSEGGLALGHLRAPKPKPLGQN